MARTLDQRNFALKVVAERSPRGGRYSCRSGPLPRRVRPRSRCGSSRVGRLGGGGRTAHPPRAWAHLRRSVGRRIGRRDGRALLRTRVRLLPEHRPFVQPGPPQPFHEPTERRALHHPALLTAPTRLRQTMAALSSSSRPAAMSKEEAKDAARNGKQWSLEVRDRRVAAAPFITASAALLPPPPTAAAADSRRRQLSPTAAAVDPQRSSRTAARLSRTLRSASRWAVASLVRSTSRASARPSTSWRSRSCRSHS